jgi:hypothetical protein
MDIERAVYGDGIEVGAVARFGSCDAELGGRGEIKVGMVGGECL